MSPQKPSVIVVEDDDALRQALGRVLKTAGFEVNSFASAEDLLAVYPLSGVDCFVVDVRLPGLSGFELFGQLIEADASVPAIFITALDTQPMREQAEHFGAAAFLAKPFMGRTLIAAIHRAIDVEEVRE